MKIDSRDRNSEPREAHETMTWSTDRERNHCFCIIFLVLLLSIDH